MNRPRPTSGAARDFTDPRADPGRGSRAMKRESLSWYNGMAGPTSTDPDNKRAVREKV